MNTFINQPVVDWARQNLNTTIEVRLRQHKILLGFCLTFLALIFLALPIVIFFGALGSLVMKGWNGNDAQAVAGSFLYMAVFLLISGGIYLLIRRTRRGLARSIQPDGVLTRGGYKFAWSDLYYLDYKKIYANVNPHDLAASAARAAMYAGAKKVQVEMVFATGKAVIPPLIKNQPEILGLLDTMPVERRTNGKATS